MFALLIWFMYIFAFNLSFTSLFYLCFYMFLLLGTIPDQFSLLPYLYSVDFNNNTFTGTVPSSFSVLTNLMGLLFGINSFTGTAPEGFSLLTKLKYLTLSYNLLTGKSYNLTFSGELCSTLWTIS